MGILSDGVGKSILFWLTVLFVLGLHPLTPAPLPNRCWTNRWSPWLAARVSTVLAPDALLRIPCVEYILSGESRPFNDNLTSVTIIRMKGWMIRPAP
eukprot:m.40214 g.40214  ORF g.40214 m.40214 type:complete len:97 (+) comp32928_c0_seq1:436-726(+)